MIRIRRLPHALRATYAWTNPDFCAGFLFSAYLLSLRDDPLVRLLALMVFNGEDRYLCAESAWCLPPYVQVKRG
jgi:hypothetical protein